MTMLCRPQKIVGGGASWYYLFGPDNKLLMSAHEDDKKKMDAMSKMASELNKARTGSPGFLHPLIERHGSHEITLRDQTSGH